MSISARTVSTVLRHLVARDDDDDDENLDAGQELLDLLKDPFSGDISATSLWTAIAVSFGFTAFIAICFSLLRPYNQSVYAPKLKHADQKHAPPPLGKEPWSWFIPLWHTSEADVIAHVGLDAAIFIRFTKMLRNMFVFLGVCVCAIIIPMNLNNGTETQQRSWLSNIGPSAVWGKSHWADVAAAWVTTFTIMFFLWFNYRKVTQLRRDYFNSHEYQHSLHARTLMLTDLPRDRCSDEGIARIIDNVAPSSSFARTAIGRNVRDLPTLIAEHERIVRKLEKVLAIYLKNPTQLPPSRPMCKPSKKDPSYSTYPKGQKVDAIEYLTQRIKNLEFQIREVRTTVDRRNTMTYGFASYSDIAEAHSIAYTTRGKKPSGSTIELAPRPEDLIWPNMPLSPSVRSWKGIIINMWIVFLTVVWVVPNAMIAIFLVNLSNLGRVWPAFKSELKAHPTFWGMFQGVANPALTSLIYLVLPIVFRRFAVMAGDRTKTGRERHVTSKLYAFFVFNNLIVFSLFSTIWAVIAGVVDDTSKGMDAWKAIIKNNPTSALLESLCGNSPFWVNWLLQRQLGAAIDLAQLWPLVYGFFMRKFSSPTPRELIELTAPPIFDYASYYSYFLFYSTVTLFYAGIQPLVLPAAAIYFIIDGWLKKYLLLYVFITKNESGGLIWRVLYNRMIFSTLLAQIIFLLIVWARGDTSRETLAYCLAPLPVIVIAFKIYCTKVFDSQMYYFSRENINKTQVIDPSKDSRLRSEKLASRFGHPSLYKPLITPMVHAKAQDMLHIVYSGRLSNGRDSVGVGGGGDFMSVSGYSDTFAMDAMKQGHPGKTSGVSGFELVSESQLDFQYYKNRPEFADGHGGGGVLYGNPSDIMRPDTPSSAFSDNSRPGTPTQIYGGMTGGTRPTLPAVNGPSSYAPYRSHTPVSNFPAPDNAFLGQPSLYAQNNDSSAGLMSSAADMAVVAPARSVQGYDPRDHNREPSLPIVHVPGPSTGALGGGPQGYSGVPQAEAPEPTQYDYFRGGGQTRRPGDGW
ncbi:hypothetical protein CFIMG_006492RA [Ceratocystis fimbriata CBS 114723]|uniref:Calcium permeable stress-gated cation channel 1 n=1 Tax=Ceratocystis fimbriata CBS 114723 TaxID=1035309 RepID=A0A2C5WW06_9PEZI|nr:hypothetical protein CFIMG_006492RA [Ceratocystis fimbriata CBS 114723]